MSTANAYLTVRGINVDVVYKDIKNLHVGVYPPFGRVRVAAPDRLGEDHVRMAVIQRLPWIRRQRQRLQDAARQSQREMVTGESHYVWGVRYRLEVIERPVHGHVELQGNRLMMYVPRGFDTDSREAAARPLGARAASGQNSITNCPVGVCGRPTGCRTGRSAG